MMDNRVTLLGKGPEKVLVLHDFFSHTASYEPLHNYLDEEFFTYAFFDLRGYGKAKALTGSYTLQEVSEDCIELLDHLEWDTFHAIGHSMTGLAIQHLNSRVPERLLTATAITPVPATGSPLPEDFLAYIRTGINGDDAIVSEIIRATGRDRYNDPFVQFKLQQFRTSATAAARLGYLRMFSENDISSEVNGLKTPYHVIIGSQDSEWHGRAMMEKTFSAFYPNCTISEIADASHFPMQETPVLLASTIERFLLRHRTCK
jgi:3-oxoadipate enol-lactonase